MRQLLFLSSDVMQWNNSWVAYPGVCATSNLWMGTEIQQILVRVLSPTFAGHFIFHTTFQLVDGFALDFLIFMQVSD